MGFFHQRLDDAENLIKSGRYKDALTILETHLDQSVRRQDIDSLARLKQGIINYESYLTEAVEILKEPNQDAQSGGALQRIMFARQELYAIERRMIRLLSAIKKEE